MILKGKQSWFFTNKPVIQATSAVGGPFEAEGALVEDFDRLYADLWIGEDSYEKAERKLMESACEIALHKAVLDQGAIQFLLCGDLTNQIISSSFAARTLQIPFLGLYGACSTSMEGLALGALLVESGAANAVLTATSSHNAVAEKQYRYPSEYGAQKPPTAQWTVTGAGAAIVTKAGKGPKITAATIGRVADFGLKDPFNMGAAMAPAAFETLEAHFVDLGRGPQDYDLIVTGDLGEVGRAILMDLLQKAGIPYMADKLSDCGLMIYKKDQPVFAGGSGCGCAAVVTYGHLMKRMERGELHRILVIATGALLSPLSYQQKESIPCVAHAVAIEQG